jgi:ribokinase
MRTAVVGHIEWVEFVRVQRVPEAGEIVHATPSWAGPGGGGAGAAVQLAKLSDETIFYTALGVDELGRRAKTELTKRGLQMSVAWRDKPTRRGFIHVDARSERTITILGERLGPHGSDALPWDELGSVDAVFFTAGDEETLRRTRASRVLVATSRALDVVRTSKVRLDALVGSDSDPDEFYEPGSLDPSPALVVMTAGSSGGRYWTSPADERTFDALEAPGPVIDRYGAGDSFAGGLTFALAAGASPPAAVAFAARCGAAVLTATGPYKGQLRDAPSFAS